MMLTYASIAVGLVHQAWAVQDACYGTGVRPVLMVPGFQGSPLYDRENRYKLEWPDVDAFGQKYGPGETDLDLPMQWDGLEQRPHRVGPEQKENDEYPSLDGLMGNIFEFTVRS